MSSYHSIKRMVDTAIARNHVDWGKRLATFMAGEVQRLDAAFGKSALRTPRLRDADRQHTRMVILHITKKHPDWPLTAVASAVGYSTMTVSRHVRDLVAEGLLPDPEPTRKPGRPRSHGKFDASVV